MQSKNLKNINDHMQKKNSGSVLQSKNLKNIDDHMQKTQGEKIKLQDYSVRQITFSTTLIVSYNLFQFRSSTSLFKQNVSLLSPIFYVLFLTVIHIIY